MKNNIQLEFSTTSAFAHTEEDNRKAFTLTSITLVVFINSLFVIAFIF